MKVKQARAKNNFNSYDSRAKIIGLVLIIAFSLQGILCHRFNNYLIFENTTRNLLSQLPMYGGSTYHSDSNYYGVFFSVFFMPFYLLPTIIGLFVWNLTTSSVMYLAIKSLPFKSRSVFYILAAVCFASSLLSEQFNPISVAFIIFSYTLINKDKGLWAALFIMMGTFIKIYGILGLLFFFFSKNKPRFTLYLFFWAIILFILPMLFSSFDYVIQSYENWRHALSFKNSSNLGPLSYNVSVYHLFRTMLPNLSYFAILVIGGIMFASSLLRFDLYKSKRFQLLLLASILLFIPLFSSGSEDCTYIIAAPGAALWYLLTPDNKWKKWLAAVIILFSTNKFPDLIQMISLDIVVPCSIMSLPYLIAFVHIVFTILSTSSCTLKRLK